MQHDENIFVFMENKLEIHPIDKEHDLNLEQALFDCIDRLKVEQKKCIRLFYFDNKCYREIASDLNFEEKKIKSFIQNGKRNLKICLENKK
jgi:RNA polymerase sigma-70 factor (ECF subfamily)